MASLIVPWNVKYYKYFIFKFLLQIFHIPVVIKNGHHYCVILLSVFSVKYILEYIIKSVPFEVPFNMAASAEFSFKAVLDLWGVNNDDIERYGLCRKLSDPLSIPSYQEENLENYFCNISSSKTVSEGTTLGEARLLSSGGAQDMYRLRGRPEAPAGISAPYDENTTGLQDYPPTVSLIKPAEDSAVFNNDDVSLQENVQSRSESLVAICDWCQCVNELKLSWCENCGRVINTDQEYSPYKNGDTHVLYSSHYGDTQTNRKSQSCFSNTKTSECTQLQAQGDSYQRHWKKSSYYSWRKPSSSLHTVDDSNVNLIAVDQLSKLHILYINYHVWNKSHWENFQLCYKLS